MINLFVGIDISKDSFFTTAIDNNNNIVFSISCAMDEQGFATLLNSIYSHSTIDNVIVAMESTGCYHINLFSFLVSKNIKTFVINPILIFNFAKLNMRKTKTDKKDSHTIARFLLANKDSIHQFDISQDLKELRDVSRERESISHLISGIKNEIKGILQTIFPEIVPICNIFTHTMLHFLAAFPSARLINIAQKKDIQKALQNNTKGRKSSISAEDIINKAKYSIASVSIAKELILHEKISTLLHLMEKLNRFTDILTSFCKSIIIQEMEIINSIDGIGDTTAASFIGEIGDIKNFDSPKSLIAFAGIDPTIYQSGKFQGKGKISKRGNKHLRRLIYIMTVNVVRLNSVFKEYFNKRIKDRLPYRKAIMATAHKLVRVIFSMLSHKSTFDYKKVNSL